MPSHREPASLAALEAALGVPFRDPGLLLTALTHRSYLNEVGAPETTDNERLEFLGDAVVDFVTAELLYRRLPAAREGQLTALRSALVCEEALAEFARRLDLGRYLRLGRGEDASGGRERSAILCNAFEALVGAVYLDQGFVVAEDFVLRQIGSEADAVLSQHTVIDTKSRFQEHAQRVWQTTPQYRTVAESGPDHAKQFIVQVLVGEEVWGVGEGASKSTAARRAAQAALDRVARESVDGSAP
jgi:ribonuclease-3